MPGAEEKVMIILIVLGIIFLVGVLVAKYSYEYGELGLIAALGSGAFGILALAWIVGGWR